MPLSDDYEEILITLIEENKLELYVCHHYNSLKIKRVKVKIKYIKLLITITLAHIRGTLSEKGLCKQDHKVTTQSSGS